MDYIKHMKLLVQTVKQKRIHKQLKEHKKKEKLERQEKRRQPKEEMIQQCLAKWAETESYKTFLKN